MNWKVALVILIVVLGLLAAIIYLLFELHREIPIEYNVTISDPRILNYTIQDYKLKVLFKDYHVEEIQLPTGVKLDHLDALAESLFVVWILILIFGLIIVYGIKEDQG